MLNNIGAYTATAIEAFEHRNLVSAVAVVWHFKAQSDVVLFDDSHVFVVVHRKIDDTHMTTELVPSSMDHLIAVLREMRAPVKGMADLRPLGTRSD